MQIKLSIIIVNYKTPLLTAQCVVGIIQNPPSVPYELLIIDNNSQDDCFGIVQRYLAKTKNSVPVYYIASPKNVGFSAGNNIGIKKAKGEYVLLLNPDTVIFKNSIDPLIQYLDEHADVAVVGPKVLNPDRSVQMSCFRFPDTIWYPLYRRTGFAKTATGTQWLDWFLMEDFDRNSTREVDWLLGAAMAVRTQAIKEVGMLDERFFLFLEDTDWCYRFNKAGWKVVYHPKAWLVHHIERASDEKSISKSLRKKTAWIHIASWIKYYRKHMYHNPDYAKTNP